MRIYSADIQQNLRLLSRMDWLAFLTQAALLTIGVLFVRHAGMDYGGRLSLRWGRQILWILLGCGAYFGCALMDYREFGHRSWIFFVSGLLLLSLVFLSGGVSGGRSVLSLPGWNFQASEPMKFAALFFFSWVLSLPILHFATIPPIFIWAAITAPPVLLIILQHDWGTALVFIPFSYAILFINGMKKRWLLYTILGILLATPIVVSFMATRQKQRLVVFCKSPVDKLITYYEQKTSPKLQSKLPNFRQRFNDFFNSLEKADDEEDSTKKQSNKIEWDDWNARQAIYSVGSGGISGRGYGKGIQHTLGFLPRPVAPTDFIFAVIAEETGFVGSCILFTLFCLLIVTACHTAFISNSPFGASIAVGAAVIYTTHAVINMAMCVEFMPIIGIPLPFVSYGGSCIVTMMAIAGLVQSVHIHTQRQPNLS